LCRTSAGWEGTLLVYGQEGAMRCQFLILKPSKVLANNEQNFFKLGILLKNLQMSAAESRWTLILK